jgi:hypothetical protein
MRGNSSRVRLEIEFLDADRSAPAPAPTASLDERIRMTVLVVAGETDLRRYVGECLRDRTDLRLIEAQTVSAAIALAADYAPQLLIVDEPEANVVTTLSQLFAIVIVDDVPHGAPEPGTRVRLLARPFTAEGLLAEVGRLLKPYDNKA